MEVDKYSSNQLFKVDALYNKEDGGHIPMIMGCGVPKFVRTKLSNIRRMENLKVV